MSFVSRATFATQQLSIETATVFTGNERAACPHWIYLKLFGPEQRLSNRDFVTVRLEALTGDNFPANNALYALDQLQSICVSYHNAHRHAICTAPLSLWSTPGHYLPLPVVRGSLYSFWARVWMC